MIIRFKSNINFTNDDGVILVDKFQEWQIDGRLIPMHIAPISVEDKWNGKDLTIHQTNWDYYTFQINVNAVQMQMLGVILLCQDIIIEDTENDLTIILDTSLSTYNTFDPSEFLGETSNYEITVKCRSNKTLVNRQEPTEQTFNITIDGTPYYTDNDVMTVVLPSKLDDDEDNNGLTPVSSSDFKKALKFVFYKNEEDRNTFKEAFEGTKASLITCFDGTTNHPLLQNSVITEDEEPLAIDFYKMVVTCIIAADRKYFN